LVKAELGTKRTCPSCATRFYDLLKDPIVCPKCGVSFVVAALLPSKAEMPHSAPKAVKKVEVEAEEPADVELVSLEDVEEPDTDDETAGIEDVDLGEDGDVEAGDEDDTFLVEEEEDGDNVTGLIEGGKEDEEEP
jgi:uncharacterized protein (TIGR02300 family)